MHKHYEHKNSPSHRSGKTLTHSCIICVGSNHNAESNIINLERILSSLIPDIHWGTPVETPAEMPSQKDTPRLYSPTYINRAAEFSTPLSLDELNSAFKEIEKKMGRTTAMRQANIVPVDIDILIYDNITVRPDNLKCNYVVEALKSLKLKNF